MSNGPSVYERFFWYLRLLTYNGFVVLIDNHLNSDPTIVNAGVDTWFSVRTEPRPKHADASGGLLDYHSSLFRLHIGVHAGVSKASGICVTLWSC